MKQTGSLNHSQGQIFSVLFLCLGCLIFSETTRAQAPVTFGINAGPNYSYIYGDPSISASKGKPGASIDFIARIGNRLFFEPDLCFNAQRAKYISNKETHDLNFITLQLPLMIGYQFIRNKGFVLHAAVGPEAEINFKKPNGIPGKDYKTITSGSHITAGADLGNLMFNLNCSFVSDGLVKHADQKMNSFSLGIGFKL